MAVITLGSPSFNPAPLGDETAPVTGASIDVVSGGDMTAMIGETDPIFSSWDRKTGINIEESQILDLQPYLLSGDNISLLTNDSNYLTSILDLNISDLINDSGYLTEETDPVFTAWDKSTGISVDTNNILDGAITAVKTSIAAINPVDGEINANKVGTTQIDTNAVTEAKILNSAITAAKLSIAAIDASGNINSNAVGTLQIQDDAISGVKILNDAIDENKIATGAVLEGHIGVGAITTNKIAAGAITANEIAAGAVTAQKITSYNFVVSAGTFTNNSPTAGKVAWSDVKVVYNGTEYTITNGNCETTDIWIYWEGGNTTFSTSASLPSLNDDDFLVASNNGGTYTLVWNSTKIDGNRITAGSIVTSHMSAGSIDADRLVAGSITADQIAAGTITANKIKSYNFLVDAASTAFTGNSVDTVYWTGCKVLYEGVEYDIADGSTANEWVYWEKPNEIFSTFGSLPSLSNDGFLVCWNNAGDPILVWNGTVVNGNRITTGSISTTHLAAGCITADKIGAGEIQAVHLDADSITADKIDVTDLTALGATMGAWNIDSDSIYSGTKYDGDGFSASIGDLTIRSDGSIHGKNFYIDSDGETSIKATSPILDGVATKSVNIGDWNMDTTPDVAITHGVDPTKIRGVDVVICSDIGTGYVVTSINWSDPITGVCAGRWSFSSIGTDIVLSRVTGGLFDNSAYDSTSYNRGWVTIQYEV